VPTYVQYGAADLGVTGKDVLMEHGGAGLYEPLDLGIARCKLMVAGKPGAGDGSCRLRIATKYVETTRRYFAAQGKQVEIIKLYGSMELAPLVGLADLIVDVVEYRQHPQGQWSGALDAHRPILSITLDRQPRRR